MALYFEELCGNTSPIEKDKVNTSAKMMGIHARPCFLSLARWHEKALQHHRKTPPRYTLQQRPNSRDGGLEVPMAGCCDRPRHRFRAVGLFHPGGLDAAGGASGLNLPARTGPTAGGRLQEGRIGRSMSCSSHAGCMHALNPAKAWKERQN